jgi:hypothetical protein
MTAPASPAGLTKFSGVARPERFELPTPWFVARYSIQLSYGRTVKETERPHIGGAHPTTSSKPLIKTQACSTPPRVVTLRRASRAAAVSGASAPSALL